MAVRLPRLLDSSMKELARLNKELDKCRSDMGFIKKKLDNPGFVAKAPAQLVESEKQKLAQETEHEAKLLQAIAELG